MSALRTIGARLAPLAVGLAVGLLAAEAAVRAAFRHAIVLYPRFHAEAVYGKYVLRRLRPNTTFWHRSAGGAWKFVTNSRGFRADREFAYDKPPGVVRVLCLGDSQTQGFECRQDRCYAAVIERCLEQRGVRAEAINAGVSGFSTAEALAFLENEGFRYAPDAVVLGFFANDLDDNVKSDLFRLRDGALVEAGCRHVPGVAQTERVNAIPPLRWLSQRSYAYSYVFNAVWNWRKRALLSDRDMQLASELTVKPDDTDAGVARHKEALARALVERMHRACRRNGAFFVLLDIPQTGRDGRGCRPSLPDDMASGGCADATVLSARELAGCRGASDIFVPFGQRHISETTHQALGVACAREILSHLRASPAVPAAPRPDNAAYSPDAR